MILGFVTYHGLYSFLSLDSLVDLRFYCKILGESVKHLNGVMRGIWTVHQDNSLLCSLNYTENYFESKDINVSSWPSKSLDLSLI